MQQDTGALPGRQGGPPEIAWTADWAPFLDIDGTLLDLAPRPEAVVIPEGLIDVLETLRARCGCLALVTGRSLAQADALFGPGRFDLAASHGAVIRSDGAVREAAGHGAASHALAAGLGPVIARHPGTFLEDKGHSVALHYRAAPEARRPLLAAAEAAVAAAGADWRILRGKQVIEIAPRGVNKGTAIEALMAEPAYRGRRPFFAGDDTTDEDGFAAVVRAGGIALLIGAERQTAANRRIDSPEQFRAWLAGTLR